MSYIFVGNLHFSNVKATDARGGLKYKCNVNNVIADNIKAGSYSIISVTTGRISATINYINKYSFFNNCRLSSRESCDVSLCDCVHS